MSHFPVFPFICFLFCALALSLSSGCGGPERPAGLPPLFPVSLTVTQEGTPLADATIALRCAENSMTWTIGGRTGDNGVVVLWTHGRFRGAPAGTFKVTISKMINEGESEMLAALDRGDSAAAARIEVNSVSYVQEEYESFETTPVEIEITRRDRMINVDAGPAVRISRPYMR